MKILFNGKCEFWEFSVKNANIWLAVDDVMHVNSSFHQKNVVCYKEFEIVQTMQRLLKCRRNFLIKCIANCYLLNRNECCNNCGNIFRSLVVTTSKLSKVIRCWNIPSSASLCVSRENGCFYKIMALTAVGVWKLFNVIKWWINMNVFLSSTVIIIAISAS